MYLFLQCFLPCLFYNRWPASEYSIVYLWFLSLTCQIFLVVAIEPSILIQTLFLILQSLKKLKARPCELDHLKSYLQRHPYSGSCVSADVLRLKKTPLTLWRAPQPRGTFRFIPVRPFHGQQLYSGINKSNGKWLFFTEFLLHARHYVEGFKSIISISYNNCDLIALPLLK